MGKLNDSLKKLGKGLTGNDIEAVKLGAIIEETAENLAVAALVNGKVPASQLPSYVDDVIEGYLHEGAFYQDAEYENEIDGEQGKIYVDLATSLTYRWSGSLFVQVNDVDLSDYYTKNEIVANPTLAGSESELEGLQIGNTKYKVGVGSDLPVIDSSNSLTYQNVLDAVTNFYGTITNNKLYQVKIINADNIGFLQFFVKYHTYQDMYRLYYIDIVVNINRQGLFGNYYYEAHDLSSSITSTSKYVSNNVGILPDNPVYYQDKTYVLKCVNGSLTWVEEQA